MLALPVTQAQWEAVTGTDPSQFKGADRPVERVSWDECQEFTKKLTQMFCKPIRLPTEAEWEYACRAGSTSEYWSGNGEDALTKVGWFHGNSGSETHTVGKLAANPWGLHDVHGNVWEWCQDGYGPLTVDDQTDPKVQSSNSARVVRGGSWSYYPTNCLAAYRFRIAPGDRRGNFGLRVCFSLDG